MQAIILAILIGTYVGGFAWTGWGAATETPIRTVEPWTMNFLTAVRK